jgi:hypothetical protein
MLMTGAPDFATAPGCSWGYDQFALTIRAVA